VVVTRIRVPRRISEGRPALGDSRHTLITTGSKRGYIVGRTRDELMKTIPVAQPRLRDPNSGQLRSKRGAANTTCAFVGHRVAAAAVWYVAIREAAR